jgi:pyridoxal 5'-phosphate synthase pdxT subunit
MLVGVLALQGAFREHMNVLKKLNVETVEVRLVTDLEGIDALIIPGGESTTITKLMKKYGLDKRIVERYNEGMAIFGTCAGAIVLAKEIKGLETLGLAEITVQRNAYGRQLDSFEAELEIKEIGKFHGIFIRAPKIKVTEKIEVLCKFEDNVVMCRQGRMLICTFHPELTNSEAIHKYFINEVVRKKEKTVSSR